MPSKNQMLKEFVADLQPKVLGHLVERFIEFVDLQTEKIVRRE